MYNPKAIELNNKGAEFIKDRKIDSALFYFDKALEIDSAFDLAYANKFNIYNSRKDFQTALQVSEKANSTIPDYAEGWFYSGLLNAKLGNSLKAIECYKQSIKIFDERISNADNPKSLKANKLNRAIAFILIGQEDKGRNAIKELLKNDPSDSFIEEFAKLNKDEIVKRFLNSN